MNEGGILLLGASGQVGSELSELLEGLGGLVCLTRSQADLARPKSILPILNTLKPWLIVNAAAYNLVDQAEREPERARVINAEVPGLLATWAVGNGAALVHYSSDYVFDGTAESPIPDDHPLSPINAYGRSKAAGEEMVRGAGGAHLIMRTAWVYSNRGRNFVRTIRRLAREKQELRVVADQFGSPSSARLVAEGTVAAVKGFWPALGAASPEGAATFNLTGSGGPASWFDLANASVDLERRRAPDRHWPVVKPIPAADYPTGAERPVFTALDNRLFQKTFEHELPQWRSELERLADSWGDEP